VVIYLDTSAFLKLYIRETESATVEVLVTSQHDPLPVWDMLRAEITNAIYLKEFWGDLDSEESGELRKLFEDRLTRGQYFVPEVDRDLLMKTFMDLARHTPDFGCRTMDIVHVACALQLAPESFVSFDSRQRRLAGHAGMQVLPETGE
jgi:predicted nucleic acid-binding protein